MKGANVEVIDVHRDATFRQLIRDSSDQFFCSLLRESRDENLLGFHCLYGKQIDHAVDESKGLTCTGCRDDEEWALGRFNCLPLRSVGISEVKQISGNPIR